MEIGGQHGKVSPLLRGWGSFFVCLSSCHCLCLSHSHSLSVTHTYTPDLAQQEKRRTCQQPRRWLRGWGEMEGKSHLTFVLATALVKGQAQTGLQGTC